MKQLKSSKVIRFTSVATEVLFFDEPSCVFKDPSISQTLTQKIHNKLEETEQKNGRDRTNIQTKDTINIDKPTQQTNPKNIETITRQTQQTQTITI